MVRGTFGNIRLRNQLLASVGEEVTPGGFTYDFLAKKPTTIFEASRDYIDNKCRSWCSPARNTAPAPRATGPPRAR